MADINLTQTEADNLMAMEKRAVDQKGMALSGPRRKSYNSTDIPRQA